MEELKVGKNFHSSLFFEFDWKGKDESTQMLTTKIDHLSNCRIDRGKQMIDREREVLIVFEG